MQTARNDPQKTRHISGIFVFLLIGIYAVFSLLLVLVGVRAYRGVVDATETDNQLRTTISYIANKVRAADGMVSLRDIEGLSVLVLGEPREDADADYETFIYFFQPPSGEQGGVYELSLLASDPFEPDMGELIAGTVRLDLSHEGKLLLLKLTLQNGETQQMRLNSRVTEGLGGV